MPEIRTIAVIGAGALGRSIAELSAIGGYRTILEDILPASLRQAEAEIRSRLDQAIERGHVSVPQADAAFKRVEYAATVEQAAREADLVIESVPDELESKLEIFTLLDKVAKPATILAANTALLSVTEIASVTYRAKKILGMRFSNSGPTMKLLALVRAAETDDETMAACVEVGQRMGQKACVTHEHTGHSAGGETAL